MFRAIKNHINYWLEKKMANGTYSMIKMLTIVTLSIVMLLAIMMALLDIGDGDGFFSLFWDLLATAINAWMPYSEDGQVSYVLLSSLVAIMGLFLTSTLIGIISSFIEEKLENLRNGTATIFEKNHTVIIGYNLLEHQLLNQIIINTGKKKRVIVICTNNEKDELLDDLRNNVDYGKNITIIIRHCDITSSVDLNNCSIDKANTVIINALEEKNRIKSLLAVASLLKKYPNSKPNIVACVNDKQYMLDESSLKNNSIIMFQLNEIMAKLLVRTITDFSVSDVYNELFDFEKNEFHIQQVKYTAGLTIYKAISIIDKATIIGIIKGEKTILNPDKELIINKEDKLILLQEDENCQRIKKRDCDVDDQIIKSITKVNKKKEKLIIFGANPLLEEILNETSDQYLNIRVLIDKRRQNMVKNLDFDIPISILRYIDMQDEETIKKYVNNSNHVLILSDREEDFQDDDTRNLLLLLKLVNLKQNNNYDFKILAEFSRESSTRLIDERDDVKCFVGSNVASLILSQLAENPLLRDTFRDLLSKKGIILSSIKISEIDLDLDKQYSIVQIKLALKKLGYCFLGYKNCNGMFLNQDNNQIVQFNSNDRLLVLTKGI